MSHVLESHVPQLREELVQRVLEEIKPQIHAGAPAAAGSVTDLLKAVTAIQAGSTQKEILRALLDGTADYCGRAALFVIKGGHAVGWQGRSFANSDDIKDFALDVNSGLAARALQSRAALSGLAAEMDSHFVSHFGGPADGQVLVLPLLLKDKVAALVYADAGGESGAAVDAAALELLVAATSGWLEVASVRKQAQREGGDGAPSARVEAPPVQTVSSYSDPFAGHAPAHAMAAAAPSPAEEPVAMAAAASSGVEAATAAVAHDQMSAEDADTHRKAQRFARLLVDEIKLYNQVKVAEGRKHKDLYDRLKEDIEKSRLTYQKRYGNTVASSADYFTQEIIRSLAEDDGSIMGANFRR